MNEPKVIYFQKQEADREAVIRASKGTDKHCVRPVECVRDIIINGLKNPDIAAALVVSIVILLIVLKCGIRWELCI